MAIIQISKIINKTGKYSELPQLDSGEFGWATDQKRLFIGNKSSSTNTQPGNTEIITQATDFASLVPLASKNNLGKVQIGSGLLIDEFGILSSASISVASANGFSGSIATSETNSTITLTTSVTGLLKGNGTAISSATPGTDYQAPLTLTTTGTTGASSFANDVLNIPQYQGVFTVTTTGTTGTSSFANNVLNIPQYQGAITLSTSGTTGFATFTNNTLNIPLYQGAITLSTSGTSGGASFANNTLNIPQYQGALTITTTGTTGASVLVGDTLNIPLYQGAITLSTTGTSGAATFANNTLNIPQYTYTLPIASPSLLGGVKVGAGLSINEDGTLKAIGLNGPIEIIDSANNYLRMRDASFGIIQFYDVKDPDDGVYNYSMIMDNGLFSFNMSSVNTPYDIGNAVVTFDKNGVISGTATSARYADLAEKYLADDEYDYGTVISVGGSKEITASTFGDKAIGAISQNPAYMMNATLIDGVYVALKGRVPVKVIGKVIKGDRLIAFDNGCAISINNTAYTNNDLIHYSNVFAIALESSDSLTVEKIEAVIL